MATSNVPDETYTNPVLNTSTEKSILNQTAQVGLNRYQMFDIIIKNTVEQIASAVSEDQYVTLFEKMSTIKNIKSISRKMHRTMKSNLKESLMSEIESMVEDEKIEEKLEKLDRLVEKFALDEGKETWRPSGSVSDDMRAHFVTAKLEYKSELEKYVHEREQSTELLRQRVSCMRDQVRALEARLNSVSESCLDSSVEQRIGDKITEVVKNL